MWTRHLLAGGLTALLGVTLALSACGGGAFADKCALACKPPSGPCGSEDTAECEDACEVTTEGLSVQCAQCVVENSGWKGRKCDGQGCETGFGPNGVSGGTDCTPCTAETERCSGFDIEETTSSKCKTLCAASS